METKPKHKSTPGLVAAWHSYRSNSKRKNIYFELTQEQFHELAQKDCVYCDSPPSNEIRGYRYNGLDRVDNNKGYMLANVVPCCARCNSIKGCWLTAAEMKRAMKAVGKK